MTLGARMATASKWSGAAELASKLVAPATTMALARLLAPEAFGVLVTAQMVISFAEIFTDAGFQKYLVQHQFGTPAELARGTNVAFWSNLTLSVVLWAAIACAADPIAALVGNPGRGSVIAVGCACIPLAAFSSTQMALFRRGFDFRTLFWVRVAGLAVPLAVTIPLAWLTRSHWALIAGMLAQNAANAALLTWRSRWRPRLWFSWPLLRGMLPFTLWSMAESVSIWLTTYVDIFLVGTLLGQHHLGVYRTGMAAVAQLLGLVTAATTPVLFAGLCRAQDDDDEFRRIFLTFQRAVGLLVIPMGVALYMARHLATAVLLGPQWAEAAQMIGLWGLTGGLVVTLSHYSSEVYRAKGRPRLSVLSQVLHIATVVPVVLWAIPRGFEALCSARALVRLTGIFINAVLLCRLTGITLPQQLLNLLNIPAAARTLTTHLRRR